MATGRLPRERVDQARTNAPPADVLQDGHDQLWEGTAVGVAQERGRVDVPPSDPDRPQVVVRGDERAAPVREHGQHLGVVGRRERAVGERARQPRYLGQEGPVGLVSSSHVDHPIHGAPEG